ncbi:uncharacterized protein N7479_007284 [Penicillium vulpinum]|uniref:Uncharacterized protein n=1 Tax=Penicillium vulpinum TaxID=29845 RepID=A0A1V6S087_9EURO|nr:uncharacterized protein N7479_007284 [Penicillium vulpinum]KAJ5960134.1 hypothetical protein N7479_007284 [Penicillium vulpinum]OQE07441.1 hypothetical protein PENVUL_c013G00961 [Penicillium vulpinum]
MLVSNTGDPIPVSDGDPAFFNPLSVMQAPTPVALDPRYFAAPPASPASYGHFLYGPPPIYPVAFEPAPLYAPQYGAPILDSFFPGPRFAMPSPLNNAYAYSSPLVTAASFLDEPAEISENKSRECFADYRKYMNWLHTVYYSSNSPYAFVHSWKQALKEMTQSFDHPHPPTRYILNQFLAAVSANPNTIPWVESLQFEKGPLPESILDEAFADFLEFEACRLGKQISTLGSLDTAVAGVDEFQNCPKEYCPYHQRLTRHPVDECFRNPQNTKRKRKWRRKQARMAAALETENGKRL